MLFGVISLIFALASCTQPNSTSSQAQPLPYFNSAEFTPRWFATNDLPAGFHQVPHFSLRNQNGQLITEKSLNSKITVVNFFFTSCPGICPRLTKNMSSIQTAFSGNEQVLLLSHSVTPSKDTIPKLRQYAKRNKITGNNWHLLTGKRDEIYKLGRKVYFAEEDLGEKKSPDDFLHTENFILVDKNRHLRGIYNGLNKTSVKQLIADMKLLLNE